ncbi:hypothetical protein DCAR_0207279 [Daucus carota subsp. sativus]|uniref:RING-type E3 ubiquitin transferase n=2 Tax=Daucus carota subsp. sativus TaxID=79200 RepID=A0AAF0WGB9_DAUCS|nr:PREDICTED: uncharacterized protein LOC108209391 [Daucus carota subsp. sativus]XP_017235757.1 PREDICTED: uncharacterized protein LOC108209391 [Daucus carota subsp. sativus]WOG88046.1 hypothetical protein DCAR_0207279 [Daucus carota subsp. sativus]
MGHRHFPNSFKLFGDDQSQNQSHQLGLPYNPMGGPSETGSFVLPPNNMSSGGVHYDPQWNLRGMENNQYASSSLNREIRYFPPASQLQSYYPFPHSASSANLCIQPHNDISGMHPSSYNRQLEDGMSNPIIGNEMGSLKRKSAAGPAYTGNFEIGSTSRSFEAGSSSSSYQMPQQYSIANHQVLSSGPISIAEHRSDGLTIGREASLRNVRSRSTFDVEHAHHPSYPSQLYNSTTFPRNPSVQVKNNDSTVQWAHGPYPASALGRPSITPPALGGIHGMNQFSVGGGPVNTVVGNSYNVSSGYPVSTSQNSGGTSTQVSRENHSTQFRRARAVTSESLRSQRPSSNSRYSRPFLTRGWRNSYRNRRSRTATPRLQSTSSAVDARNRMGSQLTDHASIYSGSRRSYDRYRDMRLDVDNMTYEELLALGERIGNVSTGLSEDTVFKRITEKVYCLGDQNYDEQCTICLDEYKIDVDTIGKLKSCGHEYHVDCIKKWLGLKKFCPICKVAA